MGPRGSAIPHSKCLADCIPPREINGRPKTGKVPPRWQTNVRPAALLTFGASPPARAFVRLPDSSHMFLTKGKTLPDSTSGSNRARRSASQYHSIPPHRIPVSWVRCCDRFVPRVVSPPALLARRRPARLGRGDRCHPHSPLASPRRPSGFPAPILPAAGPEPHHHHRRDQAWPRSRVSLAIGAGFLFISPPQFHILRVF